MPATVVPPWSRRWRLLPPWRDADGHQVTMSTTCVAKCKSNGGPKGDLEAFQRPLTLILLQKYRDRHGSHVMIQIGGVYTTFCQEEGILLQKHRDTNGRCITILFKCIGVRGRFDSPERWRQCQFVAQFHQEEHRQGSVRFGRERTSGERDDPTPSMMWRLLHKHAANSNSPRSALRKRMISFLSSSGHNTLVLAPWDRTQTGLDGLNPILTGFCLLDRVKGLPVPSETYDFKGFGPDLDRILTGLNRILSGF